MKKSFSLEKKSRCLGKRTLHSEESGAGDFGAVYMILVFAIAALLLVLIVKPMFQSAEKTVTKTK